MLNKDPLERATVEDLINDPWLTRFNKHPIDIYTPKDSEPEIEIEDANSQHGWTSSSDE